jgi:cytochrome P450
LVPHSVPFLGAAVPFGVQPVDFLLDNFKNFGDCFTFIMMGRKMTFCLGPEGNHFVFNIKLKQATAEGAYEKLTVPVFGKDVVYDVDNPVFMEQKKFVKDALHNTAFKSYMPIFHEEVKNFTSQIKFANEKADKQEYSESDYLVYDTYHEMSELTIRTASHCLMGREVRSQIREGVGRFSIILKLPLFR